MSRFVLVYQGASEPSRQEERSLLSALKSAKVVDRMPGTILIEGNEAEVASAVRQSKSWTLARERSMSAAPPHQRVRQADDPE